MSQKIDLFFCYNCKWISFHEDDMFRNDVIQRKVCLYGTSYECPNCHSELHKQLAYQYWGTNLCNKVLFEAKDRNDLIDLIENKHPKYKTFGYPNPDPDKENRTYLNQIANIAKDYENKHFIFLFHLESIKCELWPYFSCNVANIDNNINESCLKNIVVVEGIKIDIVRFAKFTKLTNFEKVEELLENNNEPLVKLSDKIYLRSNK